MGGTYEDEDPNAGIGGRLANSVKKIAQAAFGKPSRTPAMGQANSANAATLEAAGMDDGKIGRMKQAQSTDRDNSYSY
jgi:hypothetical protein